ncbi:MAG TPA: tetratricopeptide repeat protein, partial [Longimicrobiaceae bacterium]
ASHHATRMLTAAMVQASERAGEAIQAQRWAEAAALLRVMRQIRPENALVCLPLARALAQTNQPAAALDALACAVDGKAVRRATLDGDALLAPIRADPRFAEIAARAITQ